jgi:hypothetical protein
MRCGWRSKPGYGILKGEIRDSFDVGVVENGSPCRCADYLRLGWNLALPAIFRQAIHAHLIALSHHFFGTINRNGIFAVPPSRDLKVFSFARKWTRGLGVRSSHSRGIRTVVVRAPVDNLRCRVLCHDAGWISVGFKNHAAIGDSVNEVPRHPDAAGLKRQRRREHVKAPRVDFHWWQKSIGNGLKEFSGYQGPNQREN